MHICQCCFSLESASWKCLWRIQPRMNIAVNWSHRNSSERLPLYCQSLSLAARNHMEILFLIRGHVWRASAKLCKIMETYFVMRIKLVPVSLHVLFLRIKEQPGLLLHQSLIIVLDKMTRTADDSFPARVSFSVVSVCFPLLSFGFHSNKGI